jgi:glutamine amidotransferase
VTDQPRIAVVDYGIGNLRSAQKALEHVGARAHLTNSVTDIEAADAVVLPGVGAFGACMRALRSSGLEDVVHQAVTSGRPFLGICVGMQMLFDGSDEDDTEKGLSVIPGRVKWIPTGVPRPHMQWNQLLVKTPDPLFEGLDDDTWVYFVHSLAGHPSDRRSVIATTNYGAELPVAFRAGNVAALQFHPEKSAATGLRILSNFVTKVPR